MKDSTRLQKLELERDKHYRLVNNVKKFEEILKHALEHSYISIEYCAVPISMELIETLKFELLQARKKLEASTWR